MREVYGAPDELSVRIHAHGVQFSWEGAVLATALWPKTAEPKVRLPHAIYGADRAHQTLIALSVAVPLMRKHVDGPPTEIVLTSGPQSELRTFKAE